MSEVVKALMLDDTGRQIAEAIRNFGAPSDAQVNKTLKEWLDKHPEATSSVQDKSLTAEKLTDKFRQAVTNDYVTPQMYMQDGISFTDALNQALEENENVLIPVGEYEVDDIIVIPNNHTLRGCGVGNTKLKFTKSVDCIHMESATLTDLFITTSYDIKDFTGTVIKIAPENSFCLRTHIANVEFKPDYGTNIHNCKGIEMVALNKGAAVAYADIENVKIWQVRYGIYMEDDQHNGNGWVNANRFTNCSLIECFYGIYIASSQIGANEFNFQYQVRQGTEEAMTAVYCAGNANSFTGYCWDMQGLTNTKVAVFTESSRYNYLHFPMLHIMRNYVVDNGINNEIAGLTENNPFLPSGSEVVRTVNPEHYTIRKGYICGDQNNCLAFADKIATVTWEGNLNGASYFEPVFNPFTPYKWAAARFNYSDSEDVGRVIIDYADKGKTLDNLTCIGVVFGDREISTKIQLDIEYYAKKNVGYPNTVPSETMYTATLVIENNTKPVVEFDLTRADLERNYPVVSKITLTFFEGYKTSLGGNPDKKVRIESIYGVQNNKNAYTPFLHKGGGTVYGDMVFEGGGVCLLSPDGTKYRLAVANDGTLTSAKV